MCPLLYINVIFSMRKYIKAAAAQHRLLRVHCFSADSAILNERPELNARNDPKIAVTSCIEMAHVIQRDCLGRHSQKIPKLTPFSYENKIFARNTVSLSSLEFENSLGSHSGGSYRVGDGGGPEEAPGARGHHEAGEVGHCERRVRRLREEEGFENRYGDYESIDCGEWTTRVSIGSGCYLKLDISVMREIFSKFLQT